MIAGQRSQRFEWKISEFKLVANAVLLVCWTWSRGRGDHRLVEMIAVLLARLNWRSVGEFTEAKLGSGPRLMRSDSDPSRSLFEA
jgi:hypothetical protein